MAIPRTVGVLPILALSLATWVTLRPAAAPAQTVSQGTATGDLAEVDRQSGELVMRDGQRFAIDDSVAVGTVAEGDQVEVEYRVLGDRPVAVRVAPVEVGEAESMGAADGVAAAPRRGDGQRPAADARE